MTTRLFFFAFSLVLLAGCDVPYTRERPVAGAYINVAPRELSTLQDSDYLMRKASLGARAERLEAIDVISRTKDPALFTFLIERLKVEDDRFVQIRIMHALSDSGDVRAVPVLRRIARWDQTRVGIEAFAALYDLGDDTMFLQWVNLLKPNETFPEIPSIAYQALRKTTGEDLPPTTRAWKVYYETHRLAPYETKVWFWPFEQAPLPQTVAGTNEIEPKLRGKPPLPDHDMRIRKTRTQFSDFWRNEAP